MNSKIFKYKITIEQNSWWEIDYWWQVHTWCNKNIGKENKDWHVCKVDTIDWIETGITSTTWLFKSEADALMFKLKWS